MLNVAPRQIVWVIRKNRNNEYYLDIGEVIGFKVFNDRKTNDPIWKICVESWLNNSKLYNKISDLDNIVFFNAEDAINKLSENINAIILHYHKKYKFIDNETYYVNKINKTKNGIVYEMINCNSNTIKTITNKDINELLDEFIY